MSNELQLLPLNEISEKLKDRRLYIVSQATKLSYPTLRKLQEGKETNYTLDTLQRISKYLIEEEEIMGDESEA